MLVWWRPKCTAEWFRHWRVFSRETFSCPFSAVAAAVQSDPSSGDEKSDSVPDNKIIRKQPRVLSSESVVHTLGCLKKQPAVAFAYFKDIESIGFRHDFSTYAEVTHILSHSRQGKMLVSLFCEIVSPTGSGRPEILALMKQLRRTCATHALSTASNCLIKAYGICYDAQATLDMLSHLCRLGYVPSAWACKFVLKFVAHSNGPEMVLAAYDQMKRSQLTLDVDSLNIVTGSLFKAKKADEAFRLWVEMIEVGVKPHMYSSFVIGLCECGKYDLAYDVLQGLTRERKFRDSGMHLDKVVYNIAMDAYCKLGNMNEAVNLLNEMVARGLTPDGIHYTCLIHGYCLKGEMQKAQQEFMKMLEEDIKPDIVTCNVLATGFGRSGLVMEVFNLLKDMMDLGLEPTSLIYGVAIDSLCRQGNLSEAEELFNDMVGRGHSPDATVCTVLMDGYCRTDQFQEACKLFDQMITLNIKPDVVAYTVLLNGVVKETLQAKHQKLLSSMEGEDIEPDVQCYTVLIDGLCKAEFLEEAQVLFDEMLQKGLTPDVYAYTVLITGYCSHGEIRKAEVLFQEMKDKLMTPDVYAYRALTYGYLSQGEIVKAEDLFQEMSQMEDKGMSSYVLTGSVSQQKTLKS
ncbi:hypothetical protein HU200_019895 [Digitaria exilis]|uniref:Pentatricopeptide repeat-containing protein n=1 Tax=Digitaria exilis TaxID=1010633 RepID=A0A835F148_9POAL|nr:hypothetical protein HU200_019895 [Digitaria exilis]